MSIASCSLHFAVQCFYLQFRPQGSTGDKDVFPLPVTGICSPPLLPHHYEHGKNSLQVSHRYSTEFRCQWKRWLWCGCHDYLLFGCVYIHFRPLPPPHIVILDHVVLCAFRAYRHCSEKKVNSYSFVYLPGSLTEGHPRSLEEGSGKETLGSDFRRSLWNS